MFDSVAVGHDRARPNGDIEIYDGSSHDNYGGLDIQGPGPA